MTKAELREIIITDLMNTTSVMMELVDYEDHDQALLRETLEDMASDGLVTMRVEKYVTGEASTLIELTALGLRAGCHSEVTEEEIQELIEEYGLK